MAEPGECVVEDNGKAEYPYAHPAPPILRGKAPAVLLHISHCTSQQPAYEHITEQHDYYHSFEDLPLSLKSAVADRPENHIYMKETHACSFYRACDLQIQGFRTEEVRSVGYKLGSPGLKNGIAKCLTIGQGNFLPP